MIKKQYFLYSIVLYALFSYSLLYGQERASPCVLPMDSPIEREKLIPYTKDILNHYEKLFRAMEQGDIVRIKEQSKILAEYLESIKEPDIQKIITPTIRYLYAMEKTKRYKDVRELYPFMVAPLLNFMPERCSHGNVPCTHRCRQNKRQYVYMLTIIPPLRISQEEQGIVREIIQQYQAIHLALYSADEKTIYKSSQLLYKTVQQKVSTPLSPYIKGIASATEEIMKKKVVEEQITNFYRLSRKIEEIMNVIRPYRGFN